MSGPFATASRRTLLFYIVIHQVSLLLLSHAACATAIAIDVHNNNANACPQQRQRVTEGTAMAS